MAPFPSENGIKGDDEREEEDEEEEEEVEDEEDEEEPRLKHQRMGLLRPSLEEAFVIQNQHVGYANIMRWDFSVLHIFFVT